MGIKLSKLRSLIREEITGVRKALKEERYSKVRSLIREELGLSKSKGRLNEGNGTSFHQMTQPSGSYTISGFDDESIYNVEVKYTRGSRGAVEAYTEILGNGIGENAKSVIAQKLAPVVNNDMVVATSAENILAVKNRFGDQWQGYKQNIVVSVPEGTNVSYA